MIKQIPFHKLGFSHLNIECEDETHSLLSHLPDRGLAIIGTRYPQRKSFDLLEKTIDQLKNSELIIVSGFARGIDSKAHEMALEYGLKTVAILGCGLDVDYPRENRALREKILSRGGMIISPFEKSQHPLPQNFLERNQLIAHYSRAVWVVEAAAISGTLNTAKHAVEQNRDLYATTCFPDDPMFEGNQKLLSGEETDKYPLAEAFFNANSLGKTWEHLKFEPRKRKKVDRKNLSRIQRWVIDLKYLQGECKIQNLMNHAINHGVSPGQFYHEFKAEIDAGKINEDLLGTVDLP